MILAKLATQYLPGYDIEIIERHHRRKKDAPSGTASMIANQLHEELGNTGKTIYGRLGKMIREDAEIGIHAVRGGGIIGVHEVLFADEYDELTITHRSTSRLAFAAGAAEAAAWIAHRRGFYTMENMIQQEELRKLVNEPLPVHPENALTRLAV
jgi:4-hydroxy-tetrahydrodipicolinate reductase